LRKEATLTKDHQREREKSHSVGLKKVFKLGKIVQKSPKKIVRQGGGQDGKIFDSCSWRTLALSTGSHSDQKTMKKEKRGQAM